MVDADNTPTLSIAERRQQIRQASRWRRLRRLWKFTLTAGLLGGAIAIARLPDWRIQPLEDITIEGNRILSDADLRPILPVPDSAYIWQVEPSLLESALLSHPLLRHASVRRHLFPPRIEAWVEERQPVALSDRGGVAGFLDTDGVWVARAHLSGRSPSDWPTLSVEGIDAHTESAWAELLVVVRRSPVEIAQVDWRSPQNLILHTELGTVHLGPTHSSQSTSGELGNSPLAEHLTMQLETLDSMRDLYSQCDCQPEDIAFIDLTRPRSPTFTLTEEAERERFQTDTEEGSDSQ